jgi:NNP family nitrate/nitrite transporter-like MFS transporter
MGIAGAGNSGTLLSTLFTPRLAQAFGWHTVFAFVAIPVVLVWLVFALLAKDAPPPRNVKKLSDYLSVLKAGDAGWFCFLYCYCLTFGGFSGLTSYLSIFFS